MIHMTNYTINGNCSNCGECCSDILPLNEKEIVKIDKYLKTHKLKKHHEFLNDARCPFRNDVERKCEIYEVRPYICQMFKCDTQPEQAEWQRDEINKVRKVRSMKELFFKDDSIVKLANQTGLKIYKRGE